MTAAQQTDRNTIVAALLDAVPANRMVQLRTPNFKQVRRRFPRNIITNALLYF